jgi:hypothetical protein
VPAGCCCGPPTLIALPATNKVAMAREKRLNRVKLGSPTYGEYYHYRAS